MQASRQETAEYLASAGEEMAKLADKASIETLSYIFRMAVLEAQEVAGTQDKKKAA